MYTSQAPRNRAAEPRQETGHHLAVWKARMLASPWVSRWQYSEAYCVSGTWWLYRQVKLFAGQVYSRGSVPDFYPD